MVGPLTWEICRRSDQAVLANLSDRKEGARVLVARHVARAAEVPLSLNDPAVDAIDTGGALLRCKAAGWPEPLFCGRISQWEVTYDGDTEVGKLSAIDPMAQVDAAALFIYGLGFSSGNPEAFKKFTATDQSQIMWQLVNLIAAENDTGIVQGTLANTSISRNASFVTGSMIGDGVRSIASLVDGAEFDLSPVEASDGTIAAFNTYYPQQGTDKSDALVLKMGLSATDEADGFSYAPSVGEMINRFTVIGEPTGAITSLGGLDYPLHIAYRAEHAASIADNGVWEKTESVSGLTDGNLLAAYAKAVVAANAYPSESFSLSLDPDFAPAFAPNGDFWMGDVIGAQIGLPREVKNLVGRVGAASFTEVRNGDVHIDLTCDPEDVTTGVTGAGLNVVMDPAEGTVPPPPPDVEVAVDPCAPAPAAPDPCAEKKKKKKKKKK